jgi:hypothetical protein
MEFMSVASGSLEESAALLERYYEYLESVKEKMPWEAYSFAAADWHYDHNDPRCPHDAWVETLVVAEVASGTRAEIRDLEIRVRLLGRGTTGTSTLRIRRCKATCSILRANANTRCGLAKGTKIG